MTKRSASPHSHIHEEHFYGYSIFVFEAMPPASIHDQLKHMQGFLEAKKFSPQQVLNVMRIFNEQLMNSQEYTPDALRPYSGVVVLVDHANRSCTVSSFGYLSPEGKQRMQDKWERAIAMPRVQGWSEDGVSAYDIHYNLRGRQTNAWGLQTQQQHSEGVVDFWLKPGAFVASTDERGGPANFQYFELRVEAVSGINP